MPDPAHLLQYLAERRGSDLLLRVGCAPHLRVSGHLRPTELEDMGTEKIEGLLAELLMVAKAEELMERGEMDAAHNVAGVGRFASTGSASGAP